MNESGLLSGVNPSFDNTGESDLTTIEPRVVCAIRLSNSTNSDLGEDLVQSELYPWFYRQIAARLYRE